MLGLVIMLGLASHPVGDHAPHDPVLPVVVTVWLRFGLLLVLVIVLVLVLVISVSVRVSERRI